MLQRRRKFHLFNCDRLYELNVVRDLLNAIKAKLGFDFSVEKHYFSPFQTSELSANIIPELQIHFAILVVHAHEARLSNNEDDLECGYTKVYKALLQATSNEPYHYTKTDYSCNIRD